MTRVVPTSLAGVFERRLEVHADARGSFARIADAQELENLGCGLPIGQVNHSRTESTGTVRGIHMQRPPQCGWKTVTCLAGRIWDVAVDLREGSPTFRRWHAARLGPMESLHLPAGCAHGFQVLEGPADIVYIMSESYRSDLELRIHPLDPTLAISWPLPVSEVSPADRAAPRLDPDFAGVRP